MTLPSSGSISTQQIQTEIGDTGSITIPDANTRTLTGKSTGALVIPTDFYGKSFGTSNTTTTTYVPVPGTYSNTNYDTVGFTVTASQSVAWTWSATKTTGLTASHTSGTSGTDITFTYAPSMGLMTASSTTVITLTTNGNSWSLSLECDNSSYDPGSVMTL